MMPNYTPIYRGRDGWLYHDPQFTRPFSQAEMDSFRRTNPNFGMPLPSGGSPNYRPPTAGNFPTGNPPIFGAPSNDPLAGPYGAPSGNPFGELGGGRDPLGVDDPRNAGGLDAANNGGFDWKQLLLHGIPVIQNVLGARAAGRQAENVQNAQREQRAQTLALASPERYLQNYQGYLGAFKESYRPWLVGSQDAAAIGEQGALQSFDTDVARRGLSGSGLAIAGRSAIRTGRQAQIGENMRRYWTMTDEAARDAAGQTRSAEISASLGAPHTYVPRPSPTVGVAQGLGDAYRDYLWLQGTNNNPFTSVKDRYATR